MLPATAFEQYLAFICPLKLSWVKWYWPTESFSSTINKACLCKNISLGHLKREKRGSQHLQPGKCRARALNRPSFTWALWIKMPCQPSAASSPGSHISRSTQIWGKDIETPPRANLHYNWEPWRCEKLRDKDVRPGSIHSASAEICRSQHQHWRTGQQKPDEVWTYTPPKRKEQPGKWTGLWTFL